MNKEKNFISAIVYVYNNEKEIYNFLQNLISCLKDNFLHYEIICVNDNSTDNSVGEIKKVSSKNKNTTINVINMSFYQGKELAMNAGVDLSIGDFVYEFDNVEIDYETSLIMDVYNKSLKGFDIVNAKPNKKTKKTSAVFYKIFNKFSNQQYEISTDSFKILSRRAINRVRSIHKFIPYRKAVYANCGLKVSDICYEPNSRKGNKISNKLNKERRKTATDALILFTDISYKISVLMSFIMMFLTLGVAIYTICVFVGSNPIEGWTTIMLFLSFGFFIIFAIFAMIIKYLSIIMNLTFQNANYLIESIDKLGNI